MDSALRASDKIFRRSLAPAVSPLPLAGEG